MQFSFPDNVDVAVAPYQFFVKEFSTFKTINSGYIAPFQFDDGQTANFAHMLGIPVSSVSQPFDMSTITQSRQQYLAHQLEIAEKLRGDPDPKVRRREVVSVHTQIPNVDATRIDGQASALIVLNDHIALLGAAAPQDLPLSERKVFVEKEITDAARRVVTRAPYVLPNEQGLCLPYSFLKDDGRSYHDVAIAYRLHNKPDITILLKDSTAARRAEYQRKDVTTAEYRTDDFWGQYRTTVRDLVTVWHAPHSVKLADQKGQASFVEITREDGTQDYGYLAVSPGNPEAAEDTPDLMLYVIRDAKNAKAKGIEPVSKDAFLEMAQTIAASVKRRPTK